MEEIQYTVRGPKTLIEMTSAEMAEALKKTDIVLVSVGSIEQHGPHLPLGCDNFLPDEIARRVVRKLDAEGITVVAGPVIPFGIASMNMDLPGTIALKSDTVKTIIKEVCLSLRHHGFKKIVLLLGHVPNFPIMQVAAQELVEESDLTVLPLNHVLAERRIHQLKGTAHPGGGGHASEGETSEMLVIHPELVHPERAGEPQPMKPKSEQIEADEPAYLGGAFGTPYRSILDITPTGYQGNPRSATVEAGEARLDEAADWIARVIRRDLARK